LNSIVRIGTRGSSLAMWQAERISSLLAGKGCRTEIVIIKTSGDKIKNKSLTDLGGKGLFVKEIQEALLADEVDVAVHSLKDYPVENPSELFLSCIPEREDPRDVLIKSKACKDKNLDDNARVGTGSLRRKYQLGLLNPGWQIMPLRGNVDTRLRKVDNDLYDGIVLAAAGLKRLGKEDVISDYFAISEIIPAVGQGAIAIESKKDRKNLNKMLKSLENSKARIEVDAERKFLRDLQGSCTTPVGIHASVKEGRIHIRAFLSSLSGDKWIRDEIEGNTADSTALADALFERFLELGARKLLCSV
jgi:hydroxymethylbilane synthase